MKSAYPSNYLLLMPKNKTSFTCTEQKKEKEEQREKERKTDGVKWPTQEANGNPRGDENGEQWEGTVSHRWRRSAYVTCLVFTLPCSKFVRKKPQPTIAQFKNVLFLLRVSSFGSVPLPAAVVCQAGQATQAALPVRA